MVVPLGTKLAYNIVVQYYEVFAEGYGTLTLRRQEEGQVRNLTGERLEVVGRTRCDTIDVAHAFGHQRIEAHGHAVLLQNRCAGFIVSVDDMMVQVLFVLLRYLGEHLVQLVLHSLALNDAVGGLVHLTFQVCHVLHRHVGIGVCFRGGSGVLARLAILVHVVDALLDEACFGMLLTIKDVRLGLLVVAVLHQRHFHAVLDFLHRETVPDRNALAQVCGYASDFLIVQVGH